MNEEFRFEVWAPDADAVAVHWKGREHALARLERPERPGWWGLAAPDARPGDRYAFVLTRRGQRSKPLPDPRSLYQPQGVHGPSMVVDPASHRWRDGGWRPPPLASGVLYELHIGTFTREGTLLAAIDRLDHLRDLGVTHVEVMPLATFPGDRGWGYDGVDLYAPHPAYCRDASGRDVGPDAVKRFVDACHARGLAVLLDVVYNHLGPSGNYLAQFGPYFTHKYNTPWGDAVNLDDAHSDEVRRFFIDNALMWMDAYHFDGLRLDAVHALRDMSAVHFLRELHDATRLLEKRLGRTLTLVAESDLGDPRMVQPPEIGGYGMDAQWADELHHALHAVLTGEHAGYYADFGSIAQVAKALTNPFVYDGQYSPHRHRHHGAPPAGIGGERFVVFAQNHDQIGNRARGDRLTETLDEGQQLIALALVLGSPYVPMLFMGEEWGSTAPFQYFTGHDDEALAEAVREGRRREFRPFGWRPEDVPDPQAMETFEASKLDWSDLDGGTGARRLDFTRRLLALRRAEPDLFDGRRDRACVRFDEEARWLVLERGACAIVAAFGPAPATVPLPGEWSSLLGSHPEATNLDAGAARLPPRAVAVFMRARQISPRPRIP